MLRQENLVLGPCIEDAVASEATCSKVGARIYRDGLVSENGSVLAEIHFEITPDAGETSINFLVLFSMEIEVNDVSRLKIVCKTWCL